MRFCSKCSEKFEGEWKFCPVCGTKWLEPIPELPEIIEEPPKEKELFSDIIIKDHDPFRGLIKELQEVARNLKLAWPEIKQDPSGFFKKAVITTRQWIKYYFSSPWRSCGYGYISFALLIAIVITFFIIDGFNRSLVPVKLDEEIEITRLTLDSIDPQPTPDTGTAGIADGTGGGSKKEQEKPSGGGGGGREEKLPASTGKLPQADLKIPQIVAPDPHPPTITNPSLPVPATIDADPTLFPPDPRNIPYGDPKSKSTETSSGSGTGNGIGDGNGGGVGSGSGGGVGPGTGGNTGGGDRKEGGGGPGGGGGGKEIYSSKEVDSKVQVLSKPEPRYTEEARKNQVKGVVVIRAIFTAEGTIKNISATRGLPDGLTEKAIEATRQIKFKPAMKGGKPVSTWIQLEYNFNLY